MSVSIYSPTSDIFNETYVRLGFDTKRLIYKKVNDYLLNSKFYYPRSTMLTKTQSKIMQFCVTNITELYTINGIARMMNMNPSLVHRAITPLVKEHKLLTLTKHNLITVNYTSNHGELAYIEYLRMQEFLSKNKMIKDFRSEILQKLNDEYFIVILFGSAITKAKPNDYDILFIFEDFEKVRKRERAIELIASQYEKEFDITVIGVESIFEMATKRTQKNVFNETLQNHIILYGGELFYRLLQNARQ
ncbi:MAG: hypothetical protein ACMXYE_03205 [Candidatus Woesearchaeota archaeon]